jgi:hypothetical protein
MTHRLYGALVASLGAAALLLAATEGFARSGTAPRGAGVAAPHAHSPGARAFRHHGRNRGYPWPAAGGFLYGAPNGGEPAVDVPQSISGDFRYTYTYDVPWDWAHRYPPAVTPSDRPYVSNCHAETVTVPGRGGTEQAVNIMRCY